MSKRLDMFEALIAKGASDPFVHYARAMELRSLGRLEDAIGAYGDVIAQFADYVPTYLMAAQVAQELGRVDEARHFAELGKAVASRVGDGHAAGELMAFLGVLG